MVSINRELPPDFNCGLIAYCFKYKMMNHEEAVLFSGDSAVYVAVSAACVERKSSRIS